MIKLLDRYADSYGYPVALFRVELIDRETVFMVSKHEYGFTVIEEGYSGTEDKLRVAHSFKSERDAIEILILQINEAIAENKYV